VALKSRARRGRIYVEGHAPRALAAPTNDAAALSVDVLRIGDDASAVVDALDAKVGRSAEPRDFGGAPRAKAKIDLPVELRNDVSLLRIEGENSAGAVALLDARSKVRRVALVGGAGFDEAQPLLSPPYYLEKALAPRPNPHGASALWIRCRLLANSPISWGSPMTLAPGETFEALSRFVEEGGTLDRFGAASCQRRRWSAAVRAPERPRARRRHVLGGAKALAEFRPEPLLRPAGFEESRCRQVLRA
jgi:hypothetical protein